MLKYILLVITAFTLSQYVYSQSKLKPLKLKELAESAEIEGDTYSAIYYYELLHEQKPSLPTKNKLGKLYSKKRDYEKAKYTYLSTINIAKNKSDNYLNLGLSYKHLGEYDSCLFYLDKCNKNKLSDLNAFILKNEYRGAKMALESPIDTGIIFMNSTPLSINTKHMESAPYFVNDSLIVYTSQNINNDNLYNYADTVNMPSASLYYGIKQNENWIKANETLALNDNFMNIGNGFYSLDKNLFYFTNTIKNWNNKSVSQLYVCEHNKGRFINPKKLDNRINDPFYTSTQPCVGTTYSDNLEVIYFASDRPGGKGGMDIWYTIYNKKRGSFGLPINAGRRINTPLNEITPYYDITTKTLYYSSNGLVGYGGFDVFKSIGELKSWTKPLNIGSYLNSNADEIYFRLNPSRNAGFIVSNQPTKTSISKNYCCFDLAYFTFKNPDQLIMKGNLLTKTNPIIDKLLKSGVEFRDSSIATNKYLNDAVISLYLKTEQGTDSLYITSDTTDINGLFSFNAGSDQEYTLIIQEDNEVKASISVSTKDMKNSQNKEIVLDINPIEALPDVPLVIKNIYYEFGSSDLSYEGQKVLDETLILLLKEITNIRVEISSHTDNLGEEEYNMNLSKIRAEEVAIYLTKKGISEDRLDIKGYGESDPIAPNQNTDGSDNPEGRERNRRTEFKIVGSFKSSLGL